MGSGYIFTNSKGVTYHLNVKRVVLRGGHERDIYYFTKDVRNTSCELPFGHEAIEAKNGFVVLKRSTK